MSKEELGERAGPPARGRDRAAPQHRRGRAGRDRPCAERVAGYAGRAHLRTLPSRRGAPAASGEPQAASRHRYRGPLRCREEDLETAELKEQIDQRLEDHEHHEHAGARQRPEAAARVWLRYLSLSTAMIAVFAAVASLESGVELERGDPREERGDAQPVAASDRVGLLSSQGASRRRCREGVAESIADGARARGQARSPSRDSATAARPREIKKPAERARGRGQGAATSAATS